jgi:hypothetical protein
MTILAIVTLFNLSTLCIINKKFLEMQMFIDIKSTYPRNNTRFTQKRMKDSDESSSVSTDSNEESVGKNQH